MIMQIYMISAKLTRNKSPQGKILQILKQLLHILKVTFCFLHILKVRLHILKVEAIHAFGSDTKCVHIYR